jgi:transcriptional regulator with XRE-family HTH domain
LPFQRRPSGRRRVFLSLIAAIETGLRDAFTKRGETQTSLAAKLGVNKSVIHRRLTGRNNLTIETIADLVWALGYCIQIRIFDPEEDAVTRNYVLVVPPDQAATVTPVQTQTAPTANTALRANTIQVGIMTPAHFHIMAAT